MAILVTGGAGYIGSHMTRLLHQLQKDPVVLDSLELGHAKSLPPQVPLIIGNLSNSSLLDQIFSTHPITAVIHFAGYTQVAESVANPGKYFANNLTFSTNLLQAMVKHQVLHLIFSSTAAVYGNPQTTPIPESHPKLPINPYGLSKYFFEQLLSYYDQKFSLRSISLRYFNAAGASPDGNYGESHSPESHIIPLCIKAALGQIPQFSLFGTDYPTPDGTAIRDYIHIEDLAQVHLLALDALKNNHPTDQFNVGTSNGHSNLEVISTIKQISHQNFPVNNQPRREGDPPSLVADSSKLKSRLNWSPRHSDLSTIISTAWAWHSTHLQGYDQ